MHGFTVQDLGDLSGCKSLGLVVLGMCLLLLSRLGVFLICIRAWAEVHKFPGFNALRVFAVIRVCTLSL